MVAKGSIFGWAEKHGLRPDGSTHTGMSRTTGRPDVIVLKADAGWDSRLMTQSGQEPPRCALSTRGTLQPRSARLCATGHGPGADNDGVIIFHDDLHFDAAA